MLKIGAENNNQPELPISVMITSGFSSQRILINQLKNSAIGHKVYVIASHPDHRPEILQNADLALKEPKGSKLIDWMVEQCRAHNVKLLIVSHNSSNVLRNKQKFESLGVRIYAGAMSNDDLNVIKDKYTFTQIACSLGLPVAEATLVNNTDELKSAIADIESRNEVVCVKPNIGVFASGFWELSNDFPAYHSMLNPSSYQMNTDRFIHAFETLVANKPHEASYLVMPFLSGQELSVDIFCDQGKIISKATRIKNDSHQEIIVNGPIDDIAQKFVQAFNCDGLINLQARQNQVTGEWRVLEINPRPAGGIGFSEPSGIQLIVDCVSYSLGLQINQSQTQDTKVCVIDALHTLSEVV